MQYSRLIPFLIVSLIAPACATFDNKDCKPGEKTLIRDTLYFGTAKPGGVVSAEEWSSFLQNEVTPHFPDGLTVWQAYGQWQNKDESITQEGSYVLSLAHPDDDDSEHSIKTITSRYKVQFKQEAVMRVKDSVCVSF